MGAGGHGLDEAHVDGVSADQVGEAREIGAVEGAGRGEHDVHFYRGEAGGEGGVEAAEDGGDVAAAGDGRVHLGVEGVQADVHPHEAGGGKAGGAGGEGLAVGGEGEIFNAGQGAEAGEDVFEVGPEEGLAAGETDSADAELEGGLCDGADVGRGEDVRPIRRGAPLRVAVGAAEVTPLRHRYSEIVDAATEGVGQAGQTGHVSSHSEWASPLERGGLPALGWCGKGFRSGRGRGRIRGL